MLGMFDSTELELLVCGRSVIPSRLAPFIFILKHPFSPDLDFSALQNAAKYEDGYSSSSRIIQWLWAELQDLDDEGKRSFLHFVTGSPRVPIQGLGTLTITIQRHGPDDERLPSAMTCFSRLLLPEYASREKLRRMLVVALTNSRGFGNL